MSATLDDVLAELRRMNERLARIERGKRSESLPSVGAPTAGVLIEKRAAQALLGMPGTSNRTWQRHAANFGLFAVTSNPLRYRRGDVEYVARRLATPGSTFGKTATKRGRRSLPLPAFSSTTAAA